MSGALTDLIFWIVVFIVFFYGFKWLQNRKKRASEQTKSKQDDA
ncbi:MAG: hypothetical protein AAGF27_00455 [Pseudomonadota bacterium]